MRRGPGYRAQAHSRPQHPPQPLALGRDASAGHRALCACLGGVGGVGSGVRGSCLLRCQE